MGKADQKPTGKLFHLLLEYYKLNNKRNVLMNKDLDHSYQEHVWIVNGLRKKIMELSAHIALEAYQPEININLTDVTIIIDGISIDL